MISLPIEYNNNYDIDCIINQQDVSYVDKENDSNNSLLPPPTTAAGRIRAAKALKKQRHQEQQQNKLKKKLYQHYYEKKQYMNQQLNSTIAEKDSPYYSINLDLIAILNELFLNHTNNNRNTTEQIATPQSSPINTTKMNNNNNGDTTVLINYNNYNSDGNHFVLQNKDHFLTFIFNKIITLSSLSQTNNNVLKKLYINNIKYLTHFTPALSMLYYQPISTELQQQYQYQWHTNNNLCHLLQNVAFFYHVFAHNRAVELNQLLPGGARGSNSAGGLSERLNNIKYQKSFDYINQLQALIDQANDNSTPGRYQSYAQKRAQRKEKKNKNVTTNKNKIIYYKQLLHVVQSFVHNNDLLQSSTLSFDYQKDIPIDVDLAKIGEFNTNDDNNNNNKNNNKTIIYIPKLFSTRYMLPLLLQYSSCLFNTNFVDIATFGLNNTTGAIKYHKELLTDKRYILRLLMLCHTPHQSLILNYIDVLLSAQFTQSDNIGSGLDVFELLFNTKLNISLNTLQFTTKSTNTNKKVNQNNNIILASPPQTMTIIEYLLHENVELFFNVLSLFKFYCNNNTNHKNKNKNNKNENVDSDNDLDTTSAELIVQEDAITLAFATKLNLVVDECGNNLIAQLVLLYLFTDPQGKIAKYIAPNNSSLISQKKETGVSSHMVQQPEQLEQEFSTRTLKYILDCIEVLCCDFLLDMNHSNAIGWGAMHYAMSFPDSQLLQVLVHYGADVTQPLLYFNTLHNISSPTFSTSREAPEKQEENDNKDDKQNKSNNLIQTMLPYINPPTLHTAPDCLDIISNHQSIIMIKSMIFCYHINKMLHFASQCKGGYNDSYDVPYLTDDDVKQCIKQFSPHADPITTENQHLQSILTEIAEIQKMYHQPHHLTQLTTPQLEQKVNNIGCVAQSRMDLHNTGLNNVLCFLLPQATLANIFSICSFKW